MHTLYACDTKRFSGTQCRNYKEMKELSNFTLFTPTREPKETSQSVGVQGSDCKTHSRSKAVQDMQSTTSSQCNCMQSMTVDGDQAVQSGSSNEPLPPGVCADGTDSSWNGEATTYKSLNVTHSTAQGSFLMMLSYLLLLLSPYTRC